MVRWADEQADVLHPQNNLTSDGVAVQKKVQRRERPLDRARGKERGRERQLTGLARPREAVLQSAMMCTFKNPKLCVRLYGAGKGRSVAASADKNHLAETQLWRFMN